MAEQDLYQNQSGGSTPTSSLNVKDIKVELCNIKEIKEYVEKNHYSHNINGVKISYCFKICLNNKIVGGIIFGKISTKAWKRFSDSEEKVCELRRFVLDDNLGKNSESRILGICLRWIKNNDKNIEIIVSYADPKYGHSGTIYKASNFKYLGLTKKDKGFLDPETGKIYHSRALRTKYKDDFKPFVKILREKKEKGILIPLELPPKHCYIYNIIRK